jgi:hypothetical protein
MPPAVGRYRPARDVAMARRGRRGGGRRERASGYSRPWLATASACARTLRFPRSSTRAGLVRALVQLPSLLALLCAIPRIGVCPSESPSGERIRAHLKRRRWGVPRFRLAQGVLCLPGDYRTYSRGRRKHAVRNNVSRARARGIRCTHSTVPGWNPADDPSAPAAPAERWQATNRAGVTVGDAWVTVDDDCALLHFLMTNEPDVRWLLHAAIVERLCLGGCRLLLTSSYDAFLLPVGQQYFQHLLGYSVRRVQVYPPRSPRASGVGRKLALLLALAAGVAVVCGLALASIV